MVEHATRRIHARQPPSLRGVPPRYQVFDERKSPHQTVGRFYFDPDQDGVVFEVYDDLFREFLKTDATFKGKHFDWVLDVDPDAPHDPRTAIIHPDPMPTPTDHGVDTAPKLRLEEALEATRAPDFYKVIETSDPL